MFLPIATFFFLQPPPCNRRALRDHSREVCSRTYVVRFCNQRDRAKHGVFFVTINSRLFYRLICAQCDQNRLAKQWPGCLRFRLMQLARFASSAQVPIACRGSPMRYLARRRRTQERPSAPESLSGPKTAARRYARSIGQAAATNLCRCCVASCPAERATVSAPLTGSKSCAKDSGALPNKCAHLPRG